MPDTGGDMKSFDPGPALPLLPAVRLRLRSMTVPESAVPDCPATDRFRASIP